MKCPKLNVQTLGPHLYTSPAQSRDNSWLEVTIEDLSHAITVEEQEMPLNRIYVHSQAHELSNTEEVPQSEGYNSMKN